MAFRKTIHVKALLAVSETEFVIYGDDSTTTQDKARAALAQKDLWDDDGAGFGGYVAVEFDIDVEVKDLPVVTIEKQSVTLEAATVHD